MTATNEGLMHDCINDTVEMRNLAVALREDIHERGRSVDLAVHITRAMRAGASEALMALASARCRYCREGVLTTRTGPGGWAHIIVEGEVGTGSTERQVRCESWMERLTLSEAGEEWADSIPPRAKRGGDDMTEETMEETAAPPLQDLERALLDVLRTARTTNESRAALETAKAALEESERRADDATREALRIADASGFAGTFIRDTQVITVCGGIIAVTEAKFLEVLESEEGG